MKKLIKFFKKNKRTNRHKNLFNDSIIGENVRFMGENVLDKVNPHLIEIGDNCVVGYRSSILTHCPIKGPRKVIIGNYVWLGFGVYVLPGSIIGDNTIVGAGSVVTKNFPNNVIIAGNPAKALRQLTVSEIKDLKYKLKNKLPMGKDDINQ